MTEGILTCTTWSFSLQLSTLAVYSKRLRLSFDCVRCSELALVSGGSALLCACCEWTCRLDRICVLVNVKCTVARYCTGVWLV